MAENISLDTLKNNLTNLARTFLWEVIIPSPAGNGDTTLWQIRAQSSSIPGRSVGIIHVPYMGTGGINFPGKLTYSHVFPCTFIESEDRVIHTAIYTWLQGQNNDYDGTGTGDDQVKRDVYLNLLDVGGNITETIRLVGCFIASLGDVVVNYESEGGIIYPVEFRYDRWQTQAMG
jgi:hypothetical protein